MSIDLTQAERDRIQGDTQHGVSDFFTATTDEERIAACAELDAIGLDVRAINVDTGQPLSGKHKLVRGGSIGLQLRVEDDADIHHDGRPLAIMGFNTGADGVREVLVSFNTPAGGAA